MPLLSDVLRNALIGQGDSIGGAVFGAAVLLGVNALVVRAVRCNPMGGILEDAPVVLVRDGACQESATRQPGCAVPTSRSVRAGRRARSAVGQPVPTGVFW